MKAKLHWHGTAGHLIVSRWCCFHLHTEVYGNAGYRVSTVGRYHPPDEKDRDKLHDVGLHRKFETMVFRLGSSGGPEDWNEIDAAGYQTAEEADTGHTKMLAKYIARAEGRGEP